MILWRTLRARRCLYWVGLRLDAFGMMRQVLENGSADQILTGGVTGIVMQTLRRMFRQQAGGVSAGALSGCFPSACPGFSGEV